MKRLLFVILLCGGIVMAQELGTIDRAEKMTPEQIQRRQEAQSKVSDAQQKLGAVEAEIAAEHQMTEEHYMEWATWYTFNGQFILHFRESHMGNGFKLAPNVEPK